MKICLVKTSSMGDVIHTLPALTDAQNAIANLQVDWVVESAFAEIPRWHNAVNQVIPISLRRWRKQLCYPATWQEWRHYKQKLQQNDYDVVIDAQGLLKSALFATHLAQGEKHGYDRQSAREPISTLFYDKTHYIPYQQHAVERIRILFSQVLGYPMPETVGDYGIAYHFAKNNSNSTAYLLCFHSTTRDDKHWPESYWVKLLEKLTQQGWEIRLPWGNALERARAERLSRISPLINVLPKTSLTELAQQIVGAEAVISVDTGLSHLTAALNSPNIILYGATNPKLIGAYGLNQYYLSASSMADILPEQVLAKLSVLLNQPI